MLTTKPLPRGCKLVWSATLRLPDGVDLNSPRRKRRGIDFFDKHGAELSVFNIAKSMRTGEHLTVQSLRTEARRALMTDRALGAALARIRRPLSDVARTLAEQSREACARADINNALIHLEHAIEDPAWGEAKLQRAYVRRALRAFRQAYRQAGRSTRRGAPRGPQLDFQYWDGLHDAFTHAAMLLTRARRRTRGPVPWPGAVKVFDRARREFHHALAYFLRFESWSIGWPLPESLRLHRRRLDSKRLSPFFAHLYYGKSLDLGLRDDLAAKVPGLGRLFAQLDAADLKGFGVVAACDLLLADWYKVALSTVRRKRLKRSKECFRYRHRQPEPYWPAWLRAQNGV